MDTDMSSAQELAKFKRREGQRQRRHRRRRRRLRPHRRAAGRQPAVQAEHLGTDPGLGQRPGRPLGARLHRTIAFIVNKQLVKDVPHSWADLLQGKYKVTIGDVSAAAQAVNGVLAAAIANGGDEKNIKPGLEFFGKIAKQGRLSLTNPVIATLKRARSKSASSGTSTASATASRSTRSASRC